MFAITETKDNQTSLVKFVDNKDEFLEFVKKTVDGDYTLISNMTYEEFRKTKSLKPGKYLLQYDNKIMYLEKLVRVNSGYVYSSKHVNLDMLCQWELIPNKCNTMESQKKFIPPNYFNNNTIDIANIEYDSNICIIGKRGSGKTTLICNLLDRYKYDDSFMKNTLILTFNDKLNTFYKSKYPLSQVMSECNIELIKEHLTNSKKGALVFEDHFRLPWADNNLELFMGRNNEKMFVMAMQYPLSIKPIYRQNFDYIFMFADDTLVNKKRLHEQYAGMFPTFEQFSETLDNLTTDKHTSMVIVNNGSCKDFLEKIYKYQTKLVE